MAKPSLAVRLLARLLRPVVAEAMRQEQADLDERLSRVRINPAPTVELLVSSLRASRAATGKLP